MEIGMKAFYQQPRQARRAMNLMKEKGLHISHVHFYKKKWGHVENFNARGGVARRIAKYFLVGGIAGFILGSLLGYLLLTFNVIQTFQDMSFWGTAFAIGAIAAFTVPAFTSALASVLSEDKVDVDDSDFNGDQVVVDFHVEVEEKDKAENLLKENGAHNVIYE